MKVLCMGLNFRGPRMRNLYPRYLKGEHEEKKQNTFLMGLMVTYCTAMLYPWLDSCLCQPSGDN